MGCEPQSPALKSLTLRFLLRHKGITVLPPLLLNHHLHHHKRSTSWKMSTGLFSAFAIVWWGPFPPFPSLFSSLCPLLIVNNNHHVWSICCWANIKWVISAKFVWRDITFSWEGEREAESVLRLSQQMLSGGPACTHRPPSLSSLSHSRTSALSGLLPASSFYFALYPPLSPPLCPALALLNPLAVVHTHTHCSVM